MHLRVSGPAIATTVLLLATCDTPTATTRSIPAPCTAASQQAASDMGSIAGVVSYPADIIVPMTVYAIPVTAIHASSIRPQATCFSSVETVFDQATFHILDVAPGTYYVIAATIRAIAVSTASAARTNQPQNYLEGGYTNAVACGLLYTCNDHTLVPVTVQSGKATTGVQVTDFYGGPGALPNVPGASSPATLPPEPAGFPSALEAAKYYAQTSTGGVYAASACPVNRACVSLGPEHDGTAAAYFETTAGSNRDAVHCALYLYSEPGGWHDVDFVCKRTTPVFPSVLTTGVVAGEIGQTDCVHVRSSPGRSGKVVGCLALQTPVTIDGGPSYVNDPDPGLFPYDRLWWHLKGYGWMVHLYLRFG
jgi:hypothetical protein